jgi:copper homeostasis protein
MLLEICVDSIEKALLAQQAGASRIELCSNLDLGGTTPNRALLQKAIKALVIPVYPIVRLRGGHFVCTKQDVYDMLKIIEDCGKLGCKGVVLGALTKDNTIDVATTKLLVKVANGMQVTFHKAFDETKNALTSLHQVIETGCTSILSSGLQATAAQGIETLQQLISVAQNDIVIMPGGSIRSNNINSFMQIGATHIHSKVVALNVPFKALQYSNEIVAMQKIMQ